MLKDITLDFKLSLSGILDCPDKYFSYEFRDYIYVRLSNGSLFHGYICGVLSFCELCFLCLEQDGLINYCPVNDIKQIYSRCDICIHNYDDAFQCSCYESYETFAADMDHDLVQELVKKYI